MVGDNFSNLARTDTLVRTDALFLQALSFAYRHVGTNKQRGLVIKQGRPDFDEIMALHAAIREKHTAVPALADLLDQL